MAGLCAIVLASAGSVAAYELAGGRWVVAGAITGAVTGAFAPSVLDMLRGRGAGRARLKEIAEKRPLRSWARLLDPRLEVVGFVGRDSELAELTAWCVGDDPTRLRLAS